MTFASGDAPRKAVLADLNGDGTLQPAMFFTTGDNPVGLAVGDVDGDEIADVVTSDWFGPTVSVLIGNGDGTLQPAVSYAAMHSPSAIELADLDGDAVLDLAYTHQGIDLVFPILGGITSGLAALDLDADGIPDLASGKPNATG